MYSETLDQAKVICEETKNGLGKRAKVPKKKSDTPLIRYPSKKCISAAIKKAEQTKAVETKVLFIQIIIKFL